MDAKETKEMRVMELAKEVEALCADVPSRHKDAVAAFTTRALTHPAYGNKDYPWSTSDFELGFPMGRGKFGRVYCARERRTGHIVALKALYKKEISQYKMERQVLREIEIQSHLKHPHILRMLTWFHDDTRIFIVLEYAHRGELYRHLKEAPNGRFPERLSAIYTYQIASALHHCHKNKVMHRDLKPENILVTADGNLKLADFGWSVHAPGCRRKTMCGTIDYLPPEMINGMTYDIAVDVWCLGILCYEFLVGSPPFESDKTEDTYAKITSINMTYPSHMPPGGIDLIKKLLLRESSERLSLPGVMEHYWIKQFRDQSPA